MKNLLTTCELQKRLSICKKLVKQLRPLIMEAYSLTPGSIDHSELQTQNKSSFSDIVTKYDKEAEDWITQKLNNQFPGELIIGEESCADSGKHPRELAQDTDLSWIIDPIDGTTNFSRSYPFFCTNWSLTQKVDGIHIPVMGLTYNPVSDECFYATKGGGAWVNGKQLRTTSIASPEQGLFASGLGHATDKAEINKILNVFNTISRASLGVRRDGSAALDLAYVASGRIDGYWERSLSAWDVAAGVLLCEEAGGIVTHHDGTSVDIFSGEILSSNSPLHKWLINKIKEL